MPVRRSHRLLLLRLAVRSARARPAWIRHRIERQPLRSGARGLPRRARPPDQNRSGGGSRHDRIRLRADARGNRIRKRVAASRLRGRSLRRHGCRNPRPPLVRSRRAARTRSLRVRAGLRVACQRAGRARAQRAPPPRAARSLRDPRRSLLRAAGGARPPSCAAHGDGGHEVRGCPERPGARQGNDRENARARARRRHGRRTAVCQDAGRADLVRRPAFVRVRDARLRGHGEPPRHRGNVRIRIAGGRAAVHRRVHPVRALRRQALRGAAERCAGHRGHRTAVLAVRARSVQRVFGSADAHGMGNRAARVVRTGHRRVPMRPSPFDGMGGARLRCTAAFRDGRTTSSPSPR